jgi:hypothetical protein
MLMLQMCVNITLFPLGKLIVRGFFATCKFATSAPSMIKIDIAPVSTIALHSGTGAIGYTASAGPLLQVTSVCTKYEQFV